MLMRAISISMWPVKRAASSAVASPLRARWKIASACAAASSCCVGRERGVIGGRGAHRLEEGPAVLQRLNEGGDSCARRMPLIALKRVDVLAPARRVEVHHPIGPEGGPDVARPAGSADGLMLGQRIGGRIGGAQHLDVEALEQGARAEFRRSPVSPRSDRRCACADALVSFSSTPKMLLNSSSSHTPVGVPRNR